MRMSTLIETVSKKPIQPWQRSVIVEVMVENEEGEDVEVSCHRSFWLWDCANACFVRSRTSSFTCSRWEEEAIGTADLRGVE